MSQSNAIFTCHLCRRRNPITFESIDHLEAHFAQHHFQCLPYVCEQCPQFASGLYPTEGAIIEHMKLVHGTECDFEFKIIIRDDTEVKREKVRAAIEHCLRNSIAVTTSSSAATTTSNNDSVVNEQSQAQQLVQTSQQSRGVQVVPTPTVVRTEVQQIVEKHSGAVNQSNGTAVVTEGGGSGNGTTISTNRTNRTSSGGSKRNASEAVGTAKGPPVWKIPKKTTNKKGGDNGGKTGKDGHNSQYSESAAKGGYNGLNIDGLFEEMEQQQNQRPSSEIGGNKKENGTEMADMDIGNNDSTNGRDDLTKSPSLPPQSSPTKLQISKGIPKQENEDDHSQGFFGSHKSSTLGLALYKAEKEGRDSRSRHLRSGQSPQNLPNTMMEEEFRDKFLTRVRERDEQIEQRRKH